MEDKHIVITTLGLVAAAVIVLVALMVTLMIGQNMQETRCPSGTVWHTYTIQGNGDAQSGCIPYNAIKDGAY